MPVLVMKWENRDINVVEWANIPKFFSLLNGYWRKCCSGADGILNPNC